MVATQETGACGHSAGASVMLNWDPEAEFVGNQMFWSTFKDFPALKQKLRHSWGNQLGQTGPRSRFQSCVVVNLNQDPLADFLVVSFIFLLLLINLRENQLQSTMPTGIQRQISS